ncbi:A24 family peptidase [Vineibacter terrae]|uniref:A24 family peptidase n=1 Tax=Vineibacter terrae TaxID=2586908 RepID=UPI002E356690|nr:prepilin peptidase [Vineibacter terrae]HEX2885556.1 prepilin peptidase [Vineibacter terrae]
MSQALQILDQACVVAFPVVALLAARSDWSRFTIPNRLPVAIAGLWVLHAVLLLLQGEALASLVWSVGIALVVFLIGAGLFAANLLGGGDVKLLAAATLWAPLQFVLPFIAVVTVSGALLALAFLVPGFGNRPPDQAAAAGMAGNGSTAGLLMKRKTPYGVSIAVGSIAIALKLLNVLPAGG